MPVLYQVLQWIVGLLLMAALIPIINEAIDSKSKLTKTQRAIRILLGGAWFSILLAALILRLSGVH